MDITETTPASLVIDLYNLVLVEHVETYELVHFNTHRLKISELKPPVAQHYLVIDLLFHEAFGHWVYESAVYLPLFRSLKVHYPGIKLLLKGPKRYKSLFLDFFNITDVAYELEAGNACFFPSPITALNDVQIGLPYLKLIEKFMLEFQGESRPAYDYVVLPRQTKENFKPNDRTYPMDAVYASLVGLRYAVYNTDDETELENQITAVRSAPNVVVTDGSPLLVNLMFGKNQCFHVVGNITQDQQCHFPKIKNLIDTACRLNQNSVRYLN